MRGHVTLCHMAVSGNLNSLLNLFISFVKALMEQGFRSDLFLAKDTCACRIHQTLSRDHRIPVPVRRAAPVPAGAGGQGQPRGLSQLQRGAFVLGIKSNIVRGLVAQGLLGVAAGYRNGFAKLISHGVRTRHYECHGSVAAQGKHRDPAQGGREHISENEACGS